MTKTQREIRTLQVPIKAAENKDNDDMLIEGKAITFNEKTLLFSDKVVNYYEMIDSNALNGVKLSNVYLYYNHKEKALARTKNNTLTLQIRPDGLYFKAKLIDTTYGRDVYKMVQDGLVDKCSFAFTIKKEEFNTDTNTFTVKQIAELFEISLVDLPAYEDTNVSVSARSKLTEIETERQSKIEEEKRKALILETLY